MLIVVQERCGEGDRRWARRLESCGMCVRGGEIGNGERQNVQILLSARCDDVGWVRRKAKGSGLAAQGGTMVWVVVQWVVVLLEDGWPSLSP